MVLYDLHGLCSFCTRRLGDPVQIEYLKEFLLLASNMSFTQTSAETYQTQSTLSRHIAAIEEEIGAKLFMRDTHHVRLTEIGKAFYEDSKITVQDYDHAIQHVESLKKRGEILRIGYLYDAARGLLPLMSQALSKSNSKIIPEYQSLEYGDLMKRLRQRQVDLCVTMDIDPDIGDSYNRVCIGEDTYCAAMPKDHALADRDSVTLEDLSNQPMIFPDPKAMGAIHAYYRRVIRADEYGIEAAAYYKDIPSLAYQVESGMGLALIFGHHKNRYGDRIAFVPIADLTYSCRICILWDKRIESVVHGSWAQELRALGIGAR